MLKKVALSLAILLSLASNVFAQSQAVNRVQELEEWIAKTEKWHHWFQQYYNRALTKKRKLVKLRSMPEPPVWLPSYCVSVDRNTSDEAKIFANACRLLVEIEKLVSGQPEIVQTILDQARQEEDQSHSRFFERLHLDLLWGPATFGDKSKASFGPVGVHYTPVQLGRVQLIIPPGVMLRRGPKGRWEIAYFTGLSIEWFDMKFPGSNQLTLVHFNVANVWSFGGPDNQIAARSGDTMAGLSFTWKVQ